MSRGNRWRKSRDEFSASGSAPVGEFQITFASAARKDLESLDPSIGRRVLAKIRQLISSPRPAGCVKLTGFTNRWRIRVGAWRVLYTIDDSARLVDIVAIRHRSDAYR